MNTISEIELKIAMVDTSKHRCYLQHLVDYAKENTCEIAWKHVDMHHRSDYKVKSSFCGNSEEIEQFIIDQVKKGKDCTRVPILVPVVNTGSEDLNITN